MIASIGSIDQIYLDERRAARLICPPALVPLPGQYLLASARNNPATALSHPIFSTGFCPGGFFVAAPLPGYEAWLPGTELNLRGPNGKGFNLPVSARKVALAAMRGSAARVLALLEPAFNQKASVVLLCDQPPAGLPAALEILPISAITEVRAWADYLACQASRDQIPAMLDQLSTGSELQRQARTIPPHRIQILIETPVACGGLADCGVCAVSLKPGRRFKLSCKDGPVFDF